MEYAAASEADLRAAFPPPPEPIGREPNLLSLVGILRYLMERAQMHDTDLSVLNFLFVCVPPVVYGYYTKEPYPLSPIEPSACPDCDGRSEFLYVKKNHTEWANMNTALTRAFLRILARNAREVFGMANFFRTYSGPSSNGTARTDGDDIKANEGWMEAEWDPGDGIQKLIDQITVG